jgi:hypothetical protein
MRTVLETERCLLREFDPIADAPALHAMSLDPEVLRFVEKLGFLRFGEKTVGTVQAQAYERLR